MAISAAIGIVNSSPTMQTFAYKLGDVFPPAVSAVFCTLTMSELFFYDILWRKEAQSR